MTTSILDLEDLLQKISNEEKVSPATMITIAGPAKPVSGAEFISRIKELFTPEEAEALARGIEEGRQQAYD